MMNLRQFSSNIDGEFNESFRHFPLDVFPIQIQELIKNAYETKGFNKDFLCAATLSVAATAIGNSVDLYNGSYISKPILWVSVIGTRGSGKTHPLSFAIKPLEVKDNKSYIEFQHLLNEYNANDKKGDKPKYPKQILKDFTPEKLAECLQYSKKGMLIFNDELMRWINSFDQYKKGGDQQLYLELFNGGTLTVDRVSKDPIRVPETNVNILGGMQPEILKGMAKNNRNQDGFLDRFLFVYPKSLQPTFFKGLDIEDVHKNNYNKLINSLYETANKTINANESTIKIYQEWQHQKVVESQKDNLEAAIQAKLETYAWRLALVLEMMQQAADGIFSSNIKNESMHNAIKLVEYFRKNALKVHDKILSKNPLENLNETQSRIYHELPNEFKRGDVITIFTKNGMSGGTMARFLNNDELLIRVRNGCYRKKH